MAIIREFFRCPVCKLGHESYHDAVVCRNQHDIRSEFWAVGSHKMVKIHNNCTPGSYGSTEWALRESDLSDLIEVRKKQLERIGSHE